MKDQEWYDLCDRNYEHAASVLVEEGYIRKAQPGLIPAVFTKGEETVYLARELGSSKWYPTRYKVSAHGPVH